MCFFRPLKDFDEPNIELDALKKRFLGKIYGLHFTYNDIQNQFKIFRIIGPGTPCTFEEIEERINNNSFLL